jgi:hypothetical protein
MRAPDIDFRSIPGKSHLFLRHEGKTEKGASFSVLSVFVPMPVGTTNVTSSPAVLSVDGDTGNVTVGARTYSFGVHGQQGLQVSGD